MSPKELDGQPILLILIEREDPRRIHIAQGIGRSTSEGFEFAPSTAGQGLELSDVDIDQNGFDPAVLTHLVGHESYLPTAMLLSTTVKWCVPKFVDTVPAFAEPVPGFVAGLGTGPGGKVFLWQVR